MKVIGDVWDGRSAGEQRDEQQADDLPATPQRDLRRERRIAALAHPGQTLLIASDERERCRKRHLEAGVDDRFGCEQQHAKCRYRERAEGKCRAIDQHADENDADHDEGALGRNLRARQQKIECRRDQGGKRRPFLDWVTRLEAKGKFAALLPDCYPFLPRPCLSAVRKAASTRLAASSCMPGIT